MVVVMGYGKYFTKQVRNDLNKKRSSVSLPIIKKIDTIANKTAFMPNFIHSLDSANIYLLINDLIDNKININLFTIHDCFASTPESMELVNIQVRLAFSKMYFDQDYLKVLHKSFLSQIQNKTQIFKYSNNILTKYEFKNEVCNGDLVILVKDKKFIKIPPLPVNNN
jgi:DNA-directed RNA polymerase